MKELIRILNRASKAYYQEGNEIMSNKEYDSLYDELVALEKESKIILSSSPTQRVGDELLEFLPKEAHEESMLSLNKTKEVEELEVFLGKEEGVLSWKLDGLTIVLTYENGELIKGVTRGNGQQGEIITANAKNFQNVPLRIAYKEKLIVRGEAIIHYSDFNKINEKIEDVEAKYKNPRNLCSGSVRQLNPQITRSRQVYFYAFAIVNDQELSISDSFKENLDWLKSQGFSVVDYIRVTKDNLAKAIEDFKTKVSKMDTPSDGLVLIYDRLGYGRSLGVTAKAPRNTLAFKWEDEEVISKLIDVYWSPSRTGLINPVAIFEPVEIEGSIVQRASLHNVSVFESFQLGQGDEIKVYKANMIIPQISENLTRKGGLKPPVYCPICEKETTIKEEAEVKTLHCLNGECQIKKIKGFELFVSRDAMNMEGLSEETLEKFIQEGFIKDYADLYKLNQHEASITSMKGFGEKSYQNMLQSIDKSRQVKPSAFIYSLGIEHVGVATAKLLVKVVKGKIQDLFLLSAEDFQQIEGIGSKIALSLANYFANKANQNLIHSILKEVRLLPEFEKESEQTLAGKIFCVTGDVHIFENRKELKNYIESLGGKVTGSVSKNTHYLINNDTQSQSSKNKKAKELGIEIISENDFVVRFGYLGQS